MNQNALLFGVFSISLFYNSVASFLVQQQQASVMSHARMHCQRAVNTVARAELMCARPTS